MIYSVLCFIGYTMTIRQLHTATKALAGHAYRPGNSTNHLRQVQSFINFRLHNHFQFLIPATPTVFYYVTYLTTKFTSVKSIRNYMSEICQLHKQLGLMSEAVDSFPVVSLLWAADLSLRIPPVCHLVLEGPLWCHGLLKPI